MSRRLSVVMYSLCVLLVCHVLLCHVCSAPTYSVLVVLVMQCSVVLGALSVISVVVVVLHDGGLSLACLDITSVLR